MMKYKKTIAALAVVLSGALFLIGETSTLAYAQESSGYPGYEGGYASSTPPPMYPPTYPNPNSSSTSGYNMPMMPSEGHGYGYGSTTPGYSYPTPTPHPLPPTYQTQPSISITGQGKVQLNYGQVQSVSGNTLTISVFGINFTVDTTNAKIGGVTMMPDILSILNSAGTSSTTPSVTTSGAISVGDKVNLSGTVNSSTGVISASTLRDMTTQSQSSSTIQNKIQQLLQIINQLRSQINL